jgi:hypothetical protein
VREQGKVQPSIAAFGCVIERSSSESIPRHSGILEVLSISEKTPVGPLDDESVSSEARGF